MSEFLDYDPVTGITHLFDHDDATNQSRITYVQDVEPLLEYTKAHARDGLTDGGIAEGWWLYAKIPAIVQVRLHAMGLRMSDPASTKRIIQEINEHYPYLKCTGKSDGKKAQTLYFNVD